ncbi:hypothetical protein H9Q13_11965 [Pontibacter sp. JH31]|uniref:Uncharacterized protein n=1 Tax=Pontibacter aquaedesilientis TaxID=2766980 RepID=A0ABR7XI02_9BACT|nr:hypothetical protein [Pontibacter aquaedesilientis]
MKKHLIITILLFISVLGVNQVSNGQSQSNTPNRASINHISLKGSSNTNVAILSSQSQLKSSLGTPIANL